MKTNIYLVKSYLRFNDDKTPTREMRMKASPLYATETREDAVEDVLDFVKREKRESRDLYKKYWFIQETALFIALSNN